MPVIYSLMALVSLFFNPVRAQDKQSEFCSSRTTEAYHSPKCDWGWVVHDPHRVEDVSITHKPAYHTYSRWVLDGQTYVLAYRDIDRSPSDMAADVYLATGNGYKLLGSVQHLGEIVTDVSDARLTGGVLPDLVFREDCGELKCVVVVHFSDETARKVFWYGATEVEITTQPKPMVVARSNLSNVVEEFAWDLKSNKFVTTRKYAWHKTQ
jgi:hypothetical protein